VWRGSIGEVIYHHWSRFRCHADSYQMILGNQSLYRSIISLMLVYGYGQCSYLRLINTASQVHCALIMGKSRVSPLKQFTVPRLELTAATVSAKVSHMLQEELDYQEATNIFWTDSKAVLGYIGNDARQFHTFVANRVQLIRDLSDVNQWQYIELDKNPADEASRGLHCHNISSNHHWFIGPDFL